MITTICGPHPTASTPNKTHGREDTSDRAGPAARLPVTDSACVMPSLRARVRPAAALITAAGTSARVAAPHLHIAPPCLDGKNTPDIRRGPMHSGRYAPSRFRSAPGGDQESPTSAGRGLDRKAWRERARNFPTLPVGRRVPALWSRQGKPAPSACRADQQKFASSSVPFTHSSAKVRRVVPFSLVLPVQIVSAMLPDLTAAMDWVDRNTRVSSPQVQHSAMKTERFPAPGAEEDGRFQHSRAR